MASRYETVVIRNRTDAPVSVTFDGKEEVWGPHEEKLIPSVGEARHYIYHSAVTWDHFTEYRVERLCTVINGVPTKPDLTSEEAAPTSSFPLESMEQKFADDGTPLTPKVMDISTRAMALKGRGFKTNPLGQRTPPPDRGLEEADSQLVEAVLSDDAPTAE